MAIGYSYLLNSWGCSNKRGGWKILMILIKGEGENVSNKWGGWKIWVIMWSFCLKFNEYY